MESDEILHQIRRGFPFAFPFSADCRFVKNLNVLKSQSNQQAKGVSKPSARADMLQKGGEMHRAESPRVFVRAGPRRLLPRCVFILCTRGLGTCTFS